MIYLDELPTRPPCRDGLCGDLRCPGCWGPGGGLQCGGCGGDTPVADLCGDLCTYCAPRCPDCGMRERPCDCEET